jgi:hypothetical protein
VDRMVDDRVDGAVVDLQTNSTLNIRPIRCSCRQSIHSRITNALPQLNHSLSIVPILSKYGAFVEITRSQSPGKTSPCKSSSDTETGAGRSRTNTFMFYSSVLEAAVEAPSAVWALFQCGLYGVPSGKLRIRYSLASSWKATSSLTAVIKPLLSCFRAGLLKLNFYRIHHTDVPVRLAWLLAIIRTCS